MSIDQFTDSELLLAVLTLFYLAECMVWVSHDAVCFVVKSRASVVCRCGGFFLRNSNGGFAWTSVFPGASFFMTQTWPISLSPAGIHSHVPQTLNPNGQADSTDICLSWEEVEKIEVDRRDIFINDQRFVKGCSPRMARFLAHVLLRLQKADDREKAIDQLLAEITDTSSAKDLFDRFQRKTRLLKRLCQLLFAYTFIAGIAFLLLGNQLPVAVQLSGWYVLGVYVALWWLTALVAFRVRMSLARSLGENGPKSVRPLMSEILTHLFSSLFIPISAIHSVHTISKEWLVTFHPLAVAAVVMPKEQLAVLARRTLLDARHPMSSPWIAKNEKAEAIGEWFGKRLESALVQLVESTGEDPARLTAPPSQEMPEVVSYCPRCGDQYCRADGGCTVCTGVLLRRFE